MGPQAHQHQMEPEDKTVHWAATQEWLGGLIGRNRELTRDFKQINK